MAYSKQFPATTRRTFLKGAGLVSAAVLAFFGILLVLDQFRWLTARLSDLLDTLGLRFLVDLG